MLETSFVFVDTQAFRAARFAFDGGSLKRLCQLVKSGRLDLVMPTITKREIRKKLSEHVDEVLSAVQSARTKATILRQSQLPTLAAVFS